MQTIALSADALDLLRLHVERRGEIAVDDFNREAYRELARAGLMVAGHSFRDGRESIFALTEVGKKMAGVLDRWPEDAGQCDGAGVQSQVGSTVRRVAELRIDPAVQARVDVLAERANEGLLTPVERAEYEAYIDADDFIAMLKLKAQRYLDDSSSP